MNITDQIIRFEGKEPGPTTMILVGVHGNEVCGVEALQKLEEEELFVDRGVLLCAYGNPLAIEKNQRLTEANLNRMFQDDSQIDEEDRSSYEYKRSRFLLPYLDQVEYLLDVHASNTPDSTPFVICEKNGEVLAQCLPVDLQVQGFDAVQPGGTDGYVNRKGGIGLCVECGYTKSKEGVALAKESIWRFLQATGNIQNVSTVYNSPRKNMQEVLEVDWLYKTKTDAFVLTKEFADFEKLSQGDSIAHDGAEQIVAPYDGFIVFARTRDKVGAEGFLFGRVRG